MDKWLENASRSLRACGISTGRHAATDKELSDLRTFKRGVFLNRDVVAGEVITKDDIYYAFPCKDKQVLANDMSKYVSYVAKVDMGKNESLLHYGVKETNTRQVVLNIRNKVNSLLKRSNVVVPKDAPLEISHHYGIKNFYDTGLCMITVVNEGYCKKLLISLANQEHPTQYHKQKTETFVVLYGEVKIFLDGDESTLLPGEVVTIQPGVTHRFIGGSEGSIIEEISTTHFVDDSYYEDESISKNKNRKTMVSHWIN
jgi:D-lyxose ketol-isomerase